MERTKKGGRQRRLVREALNKQIWSKAHSHYCCLLLGFTKEEGTVGIYWPVKEENAFYSAHCVNVRDTWEVEAVVPVAFGRGVWWRGGAGGVALLEWCR